VIKTDVKGLQKAMYKLSRHIDKAIPDGYVVVGIHADADAPTGDADISTGDAGINNATLGATLHFGTRDGHIPARPWLDVGVNESSELYIDTIADGIESGTASMTVLNQVGVLAVGSVQSYMTNLSDPPNAPSTIAAKGSANPLIDTGELRQSVTYTITKTKPKEGLI